MKKALLADYRRYIDECKQFSFYMEGITLEGVDGIEDTKLSFSSALISICGRNGVGKTSFLKLIYRVLTKEDLGLGVFSESNIDNVSVELIRRGKPIIVKANDETKVPKVFYFDPSTFALKIIDEYKRDEERNGWLNGTAANDLDSETLRWVNKITGKSYDRITISEVSGIIDDTVFPYFEVSAGSRIYHTQDMGQGEHKILIMVWRLISLDKESILIVEEPESFICPVSQIRLMEFIVTLAFEKKINIVMSTHSEHILQGQGIKAINVMSQVAKRRIVPDHLKALSALGLTPEKKNVLLVEDSFAKLVLESILKAKLPDFFMRSYIHVLAGESNIQMLSKHYRGITGLSFTAVYDADQITRNDNFVSNIAKVFLPSVDKLPPEAEVIKAIKQHATLLAQRIDFPDDYHEFVAIVNKMTSDPHDFFLDLVSELEGLEIFYNVNELKQKSIKLWIELNSILIDYFVFELQNITNNIFVNVMEKDDGDISRFGSVGVNLTYELDKKFDSFPAGQCKGKLMHCHVSQKIMLTLLN
ncbi:AAA family ATPase [Pseudomonas sp. K2I15]|uniref:AAA family ATPase n=1 Tax=Pseudomonas sp. K2I15 TaxID=2013577 RepID=UPI000B4C94DC|nr:AAA family ATPase [Pseudomonas sp. K2I15]OWP72941.1 hypothetical protein CEC48_04490 [Pseudomonas sp. K2I15]